MKNYLAGLFFAGIILAAGLIIAALGTISYSLAESPGTGGARQPAVSHSPAFSQSFIAGGAKAIIPPLTRMPPGSPGPPGPPASPGKKKNTGGFGDLPMTPPNSDMEDCFNDEIPYTPIPQG